MRSLAAYGNGTRTYHEVTGSRTACSNECSLADGTAYGTACGATDGTADGATDGSANGATDGLANGSAHRAAYGPTSWCSEQSLGDGQGLSRA